MSAGLVADHMNEKADAFLSTCIKYDITELNERRSLMEIIYMSDIYEAYQESREGEE